MSSKKLQEVSEKMGIPTKELQRLLALPYSKGKLPSPLAFKNIGFAKGVIGMLQEELEPLLRQKRKDAQSVVNSAFRLIICNLVVSVFSRSRLSLAGSEKSYNNGEYLNSLFLTFRAVNTVTKALITEEYLTFKKGSKLKKEVNSYKPTKKLELLLLPLLYEIQEEYLGDFKKLIITTPCVGVHILLSYHQTIQM